MKKNILLTVIAILAVVLIAGKASAQTPTFDEFKMVDGLQQDQNVFGWDETPYLYYKINPISGGTLDSLWLDNGFNSYQFSDVTTDGEDFFALPNWNSVKAMGTWNVYGTFTSDQGLKCQENDCGFTSFVVTPEPASMVLFGLGGLPLAAGLLRRKKKA